MLRKDRRYGARTAGRFLPHPQRVSCKHEICGKIQPDRSADEKRKRPSDLSAPSMAISRKRISICSLSSCRQNCSSSPPEENSMIRQSFVCFSISFFIRQRIFSSSSQTAIFNLSLSKSFVLFSVYLFYRQKYRERKKDCCVRAPGGSDWTWQGKAESNR